MFIVKCSVEGIESKNSKTQVKNAIDQIQGVQEVGVNRTTGTVEVKYNEPATEDQIMSCIEHSGFKVVYE